jgi:cellulose synthase (UDP-forming)
MGPADAGRVVLRLHRSIIVCKETPVRMAIAYTAILLMLRYSWWRWTATILPMEPELTFAYAWTIIFWLTELALSFEACIFLIMMSRTTERHAEGDANVEWAATQSAEALPTVDVFIPTYNEGWDVLEKTIIGAAALDYPNVKIYVLDDGSREWLPAKCEEHGAIYVRRPDRAHAKAGNINHAMRITHGDLILVFDADFVAQRNFLRRTVGFFRDPTIGVVQVPHHFFNADPLQMNLKLHQQHSDDQEFFFVDIMPARDAWGVAFSCGSNSLVRRSAMELIDGIPTSSITEDILTSVVMLQHGYRTVFLNERLARGLAPEGLSAMYVQRARWARGGIQLLFLNEGPVLAKGLTFMQRLFFMPFSWVISPLGLVIMTLGPILFMWTGLVAVPAATGDELIQYQVPMILASVFASRQLARVKRNPFVALAHQTFMAFRLVPAVVHSLFWPFAVGFKVTPKGKLAQGLAADGRAIAISLGTIVATVSGIIVNELPDFERVPPDAFLTPSILWGSISVMVMTLCLLMAFEFPRTRGEERFEIGERHAIDLDGVMQDVLVEDLSISGASLDIGFNRPAKDTKVDLVLSDVGRIPARVVRWVGEHGIGLAFDEELNADTRRYLIAKIFTHGYENKGKAPTHGGVTRALLSRLLGDDKTKGKPMKVVAATEAGVIQFRPELDVTPEVAYPRLATVAAAEKAA